MFRKYSFLVPFVLLLTLVTFLPSFSWSKPKKGDLTLVGYVPGRYIKNAKSTDFKLAKIVIKDGWIREVKQVARSKVANIRQTEQHRVVVLKREGAKDFDVIYPGLIDLHNHTKQNNLGLWKEAIGQFANRFEWRAWGNYKKAVSGNMNPWIGFGKPVTCAAFRWSELQAMVLGTTYLQGPSSCIGNFGIHRVEDAKAFLSKKKGVQAPTDIILPSEMVFVWNTVTPIIMKQSGFKPKDRFNSAKLDKALKNYTYEEALRDVITEHCPKLKSKVKDVNSKETLAILTDQDRLKEECDIQTEEDKARLPEKFIRYVYWVHKTIAGRKKYLESPNRSAVIGHLSEGRRLDPYNQVEFELLKVLGLDQKQVNLVHAVGLGKREFKHMAKKGMGLIWSLFSNLLLYGETADIGEAIKAGVTVAVGSDWTPTGSRSVLEELKVVREYVMKPSSGLAAVFPESKRDEMLYEMVTENPAKMISHFEEKSGDGEHGIGVIKKGAMGTLIVASRRKNQKNPYTNLVTTDTKDINLVVVDGTPVYGNVSYIDKYDSSAERELLPNYLDGLNRLSKTDFPEQPQKMKAKQKLEFLDKLAQHPKLVGLVPHDECGFDEPKAFLAQESGEEAVVAFHQRTGLNLDRFEDIQKLIGVNLMTQNRNLNDPKKGDPDFAPSHFPSLYSCNDSKYLKRFSKFVQKNSSSADEDESDKNARLHEDRRKRFKLGSVPKRMKEKYQL